MFRPHFVQGAGARLHKHKINDESNKANWRDRDNRSENPTSDWNNKPKTDGAGWVDPKKSTNPSKGWEHDDRFQNDYS